MKKSNNILMSIIILFIFIGCGEGTTSGDSTIETTQNIMDNSSNESTKTIYGKCAGCHGQNGKKSALGKSAVIGGDNKEALLYQLEEYKAGRLDQYGMGQLMKGQVVALSHSELESVSEYISKLSGI